MTISIWPLAPWVALGLLIVTALSYLITAVRPGIRHAPGPFLARFTNWWRVAQVVKGQYPQKLLELHKKHGPIVRIGPNQVSISDPQAVPQVYGFTAKYLKVRCLGLG